MNASHLGSLALTLGAVGVLLLAVLALLRLFLAMRSKQALEDALEQRTAARTAASARAAGQTAKAGIDAPVDALPVRARFARLFDMLSQQGARMLETNFGKQIVTEEERHLLDQCGYSDLRTRSIFLSMRIICMLMLPFVTLVVIKLVGGAKAMWIIVAASALLGMMLPKFYIQRRASKRRQAVVDEMPLLVDMMRLLQGVGLSLDQSMHVVTNDFQRMMPVLSYEFGIAQRQFVTGRSREQSLQRLTNSFDNEDLRAVVRLLIQVDKHGGAVQEPFKQFGDRMREGRRALLRERIGKLTVKMTAVMILTLLPALFIVTAGPGVMGVLHAFAQTENSE